MGLTQLQRAYKRQLTDLYDADDEDEVTPSRKRHKPTPADGDTRVVVKHRCTGQRVTPSSSPSQDYYCDSPPPNQEAMLPWGPVEVVSDSDSDSTVVDPWILNTPLITTTTWTRMLSPHPPLTRKRTMTRSNSVLHRHHHSRKTHQRQHQLHCMSSRMKPSL